MLIGKPLDNVRLYVLDARKNLLPVGVPGELYIAGAGLANGYLNNPEGTAARFVEDPYYPGERMYRTGDRVKWTADGQLEFLGRIDAQVKIRGFRIELEEIQSVLAAYPGVQDAVVLAQESDNDKFLVAYYTAAATLEAGMLKAYLAAKLPRYMVPAYFMQLQQWPLNRSGKLDRKALPLPGFAESRTYVAPSGPVEKQLLQIWAAVLKQPATDISANDNFFERGGHSLSAAVMVNKIEKELQVAVPLREVFNRQTLTELALFIGTAAKRNFAPLQPGDDRPFFPLTSAQRRLYFLYEFNSASVAYNLPHVLLLEGLPDIAQLQHALTRLIGRHSILRTTFHVIDGMPVQKVAASAAMEIEYLQADEPGLDAAITAFIRPFDLSRAPLLRVALIALSPVKHALVLDVHHIVADGVSQAVLAHDIAAFYQGAHLPPLTLQYKDYAVWQQESAWQQEVTRQRSFWLQQFDETPVLELPADHPRPAVKSYHGDLLSFTLSREETARLHAITAAAGATPFMTLFAAYLLFLDKLTNKQDIVIGTLVGGRRHADLEPLIGMFVNTLAIRSNTSDAERFTDLLFNVKQHVLDCFEHQDYPYEMLIDELQLTRDTGRNPLFDVMFMFQNFEDAVPEMEGMQVIPYHSAHTVSKFDLTLIVSEKEGQLHLHFEYATDLFNRSTIEKWIVYFRNIITAIAANEQTAIAAIDMLPPHEKMQLIKAFNNTQSAFPVTDNIITRFEEQAAATPHAIALVAGSTPLTYAALKQMADNIAAHLRYEQEVQQGDFVGFMLERDAYLMPAILGILKAGAAYVPIDPAYPVDRIRYMLEDSGIKVVLISPAVGELFHPHAQEIRFVDVTVAAERDAALPQVQADFPSTSLAYMIYTSGSSGTPKGVMVTHRNVVNFVHGINQRIDLSVGNAMLCLTTVSFDIFVLETLLPLLSGKRIVLAGTAEVRDPHTLCRLIREQQVDFMQLTPSHLRLLLASGADDGVLQERKVLMAGGEPFPPELLQQVKRVYAGRIYNMYGPTETTVWSTVHDLTDTNDIHIGKPIANTTIRILDPYGQLLPVGGAGELCIGGEGLSAGYWQREDLTREKFIPDPLDPAQLIYRTGDLACWLPDGNISFMGRLDDQVKIRGHRIEPGEIAHLLMLHPAVKEAVVAAKGTGADKYLAAWYVLQQPIAAQELQSYLQDKLPAYMVPAYFIALPALPLTPNGKLDRKQLPEPQRDEKAVYVAPAGKTEQQLAGLWSEILQTDLQHVSADRSFFELGGHSLNAMVMIARVQQDFGVKIPLATFFRKPTITALGKDILIARLARKTDQATEKVTI
jgi:amino acid adenylation domain-containing protein